MHRKGGKMNQVQKVVWAAYLYGLGIKYKLSEKAIAFLVAWYLD
jgi:hypothetical protein